MAAPSQALAIEADEGNPVPPIGKSVRTGLQPLQSREVKHGGPGMQENDPHSTGFFDYGSAAITPDLQARR